ncbi:hypothetical protein Goari_018442 [Gossypium aridum]|uniref:Uncharacterized protein n=1 Tax=Gossypium aridum TaxID=34290 RepID=A0A7J8WQS1_GOSAI|nr:hypothetical protein [Gossypium aridum]
MTRMKYDLDDDFAKETRCEDRDNLGQPSGKYSRTPDLHKSRATKRASYCLQGEIELSQKWLLEENLDVKSCFNTPKQSESIHCSTFSCFTSEKFAFCQSLNHTNSFDSPVFWINQACPISRFRKTSVPLGLFDAGQYREIGFLDLSSVQGRINGDDKRKSKSPPANCEQLEFEMENCLRNDLLFSKGVHGNGWFKSQ